VTFFLRGRRPSTRPPGLSPDSIGGTTCVTESCHLCFHAWRDDALVGHTFPGLYWASGPGFLFFGHPHCGHCPGWPTLKLAHYGQHTNAVSFCPSALRPACLRHRRVRTGEDCDRLMPCRLQRALALGQRRLVTRPPLIFDPRRRPCLAGASPLAAPAAMRPCGRWSLAIDPCAFGSFFTSPVMFAVGLLREPAWAQNDAFDNASAGARQLALPSVPWCMQAMDGPGSDTRPCIGRASEASIVPQERPPAARAASWWLAGAALTSASGTGTDPTS